MKFTSFAVLEVVISTTFDTSDKNFVKNDDIAVWALRYSRSIACRRCSNYIFILDLTRGFNGLGKGNCKTRQESFRLCDLVRIILEVWRYYVWSIPHKVYWFHKLRVNQRAWIIGSRYFGINTIQINRVVWSEEWSLTIRFSVIRSIS